MREEFARKILEDVSAGYDAIAPEFAATRTSPWPEMARIAPVVPVGGRVLDVGCGNGRAYQLFAGSAIEYDGLDVSAELIAIARREHQDQLITFRVGSVLALPYEDETFDAVLMIASLHHVPSAALRRRALEEGRRVLKPGGSLFMTNWDLWGWSRLKRRLSWMAGNLLKMAVGRSEYDWNDSLIPWKRGVKVPVQRYYHCFTLGELARLCRQAGFEVLENDRVNEQTGRDRNLVTVCRKPGTPSREPRGVKGL
jgi:alkylated DNA repair protein alkB family protein 8